MGFPREQAPSILRVRLLADVVACAGTRQTTPDGDYNIKRMLHAILSGRAAIILYGSCGDAASRKRVGGGLEDIEMGATSQLAEWTAKADFILTF